MKVKSPTPTKSKKRQGKKKSKETAAKEIKSIFMATSPSGPKATQFFKPPGGPRVQHVMTNLGIPKLQDSKYTVTKFVLATTDTNVKAQVKKAINDNEIHRNRDRIKGKFGDYFLKYASPSITDDKHIVKKKGYSNQNDLSTGVTAKQLKWPYDYRPIICKHSAQNELQASLNKIFPPKQWTTNGEHWHQSVSCIPAARIEVINIKTTLDNLLKSKNTKVYGLCSIRLDLYLQCFDELIRQVTICCVERGMIMAQVRDTIKSTLWSYHTVYESCCALGLRKTLNHEEELLALSDSITDVLEERDKIREKIGEMEKKIESVKEVFLEHSNLEERKHLERMTLLKKANDQIKDALIATAEYGPKKKKDKPVVAAPVVAVRTGRGHK